jgi:5-formyltetrahydrofolate cyclo-ligase
MPEKAELRKQMLAERDKLDIVLKSRLDLAICNRLEDIIEARNAKVVHSYLPMGSEIDVYPLLEHLLTVGVTVITPKSLKGRQIKNLQLHSLEELEEGIYGTKHPAHDEEYTGPIDVYIIPGLAFDKKHYRVGYGGGYYDSHLAGQEGYKVGICYPFQLVDELPVEAHDVPMDAVVY